MCSACNTSPKHIAKAYDDSRVTCFAISVDWRGFTEETSRGNAGDSETRQQSDSEVERTAAGIK